MKAFVNVGTGKYASMTQRLRDGLSPFGVPLLSITELPAHWPSHSKIPYCFKIRALQAAIDETEFTTFVWLDSSMVPMRDPAPLFDHIAQHGYYLWKSGWNCAQSINDQCLANFGVTRDEAEAMPECGTGLVGFDLTHPLGKAFWERWKLASTDGSFIGSRLHNPKESSDPRFRFHRQDQSAASLAANLLGMTMHEQGHFVSYQPHDTPTTLFQVNGR